MKNSSQGVAPGSAGEGRLPAWILAAMVLLTGAVMLGGLLGSVPAFAGAMTVVLTDGIMAGLVLLAAGGYGYLVYRMAAPKGAPRLLALATAAGLGLWMLSTAVLAAGTFLGGALSPYVWWPVIGLGAALALAQAHRGLGKAQLPSTFSGGSLVWVLVAAAVAMWLAGAVLPPGFLGNLTADSYDILEYHLQLPRQYLAAGRIAPLDSNVYSYFPQEVEMLFLLGMCLRGGAYQGMYLAKLFSGIFGLLAVAGVFGGLAPRPAQESEAAGRDPLAEEFRRRAAVALLATAPWVIYFSWLAMVELAEICYLALALLWLRRWLEAPSARLAGWIGVMLGAACAVKYLSVGLVAAPVLAAMLAGSLRRPGALRPASRTVQFGQVALAGMMTVLLPSPWLIRNASATGNPVFPLATSVFGDGAFSPETAQRWRAGHGPAFHPPVPVPPGYEPPERQLSRSERFSAFLLGRPGLGNPALGAVVVVLALGTVFAMFARPRSVPPWSWALLGVIVVQMAVWALATHEMPARFAAVCVAPISLLCAGGLGRLAGVREVRWLRQQAGMGGRWGMAPAGLLLVAAAALNLGSAGGYYRAEIAQHRQQPGWSGVSPAGWPAESFAALPDFQGRLLLVGEARAFYFPAETIYATVFDSQPLEGLIERADLASRLAAMGVTHVGVGWSEIRRLMNSYGWPAELRPARLERAFADWPIVSEVRRPTTASGPAGQAPPIFTLYALPGTTTSPAAGAVSPATAEAGVSLSRQPGAAEP